jgi:hypothetical protein
VKIDLAIAQAEQRLQELKLQRDRELRSQSKNRDKRLAATLQALLAVDRICSKDGVERARAQTAIWLTGSPRFIDHGTYRQIRISNYEILVKSDLIDPDTDSFRFEPGIIV